jgi:hypothetical protein
LHLTNVNAATIQGNHIGVGVAGKLAAANTGDGIAIDGASTGTIQIGGVTPEAMNLLSNNLGYGISAISGTVRIEGNRIGTDVTGTSGLGNGTGGVFLGASTVNARLGSNLPGSGNLISGNLGAGVRIDASGARLANNLIGTTADGMQELGNAVAGVLVFGANNQIGVASEAGNLISGNFGAGVQISGANASGNSVLRNWIGIDAAGAQALRNAGAGVQLSSAGANNVIGSSGEGNVISGNTGSGILITNSNGTLIRGNIIGLNAAQDTDIANQQGGIRITGNSSGTIVGGSLPGQANVIAGNIGGAGVSIRDTVSTTRVEGNFIGANASEDLFGNLGHGIHISSSVGGHVIESNLIAWSEANGVTVSAASSTGNRITLNRFIDNLGLAIDLGGDGVTMNDASDADTGANDLQNAPVVTSAISDGVEISVAIALASAAGRSYRIEVFSTVFPDPSGYGEADRFVGAFNVTTDASGNASWTQQFATSVAPGQFVSVTATDLTTGSTSEFSLVSQVISSSAPPELGGAPPAVLFIEDGSDTTVAPTITVSSPSMIDIVEARIEIVVNYQANADELGFMDTMTIFGGFDPLTGRLTLSGVASAAEYQAALRTIVFTNTSDTPPETTREVRFSVFDGQSWSTPLSVFVAVLASNDAPDVTLPASFTVTEDLATPLTAIGLDDPDAGSAAVRLTVTVDRGTLVVAASAGVVIGGSDSARVLEGSVSDLANMIAAGRIRFLNAPGDLSPVNLQVELDDLGNSGAGGPLSLTASSVLMVSSTNQPPDITLPATLSIDEDTVVAIPVSVSDPDGAIQIVRLSVTAGSIGVDLSGGATILEGSNASGAFGLGGTLAQINAALGSLRFTPPTDFHGTTRLDVTAVDPDGAIDTDFTLIQIASRNDAPSLIGPSLIEAAEDAPFVILDIEVSDVDAGASPIALRFISGAMRFGALSANGVTVTGTGSADLTLTGTVADLNAFISQGLLFGLPIPNVFGLVNFQVFALDGGASGNGGALQAMLTVPVELAAFDDPPRLDLPAMVAVDEDVESVLISTLPQAAQWVQDPDADTTIMRLTVRAAQGTLSLGAPSTGLTFEQGDGIADTQFVVRGSLADLRAALVGLRYLGAQDAFGLTSIDWVLEDNADGSGVSLMDDARMTLDVRPVNDAPRALELRQSAALVEGSLPATLLGELVVSDIDDLSGHRFSLANDAQGRFVIDPVSGQLRTGALALDPVSITSSYWIQVRAVDPLGGMIERAIRIDVAALAVAPSSGTGQPGSGSGAGTAAPSGLPGAPAVVSPTSGSGSGFFGTGSESDAEARARNAAIVAPTPTGFRAIARQAAQAGASDAEASTSIGAGFMPRSEKVERSSITGPGLDLDAFNIGKQESDSLAARLALVGLMDRDLAEMEAQQRLATNARPTLIASWFAADDAQQPAKTQEATAYRVVVETVQVGGVLLTVGLVLWVTRAGTLVAAMLTSLPTWKALDPLVLLDHGEGARPSAWSQTLNTELDAEEAAMEQMLESGATVLDASTRQQGEFA